MSFDKHLSHRKRSVNPPVNSTYRYPVFLEVISKLIFGVILNQPKELKLGTNHPPLFSFLKGGQGGLNKRLIIPLNPPLVKGDLKPPFPTLIS